MPIPIEGFNQHYDDPDEYFHHNELTSRVALAAEILEQTALLIGRKGRLLDIGSGRGEVLRAAQEMGWHAFGIEPSPAFAKYAATFSGADVINTPLENCDFESSFFDSVILGSVLEHLYNPDQTIKEIARILSPKGALFIDVPNEAGLYFVIGNAYQRARGRDWVLNLAPTFSPYHVFGYSPRSLQALLNKHGLVSAVWKQYKGVCCIPSTSNLMGKFERAAAGIVTAASRVVGREAYIETWAVKL